jgi:hypothetical protein
MKYLSVFLILFALGNFYGQNTSSSQNNQFFFEPTVLSMRSSHHNYFNGFSLLAGNNLTQRFSLAVGVEYSGNKHHHDNNWQLYNLTFKVILIREQFRIFSENKFKLSGDFREGISFVNYEKEEPLVRKNYRYHVREKGLYFYGGFDAKYQFSKKIAFVADFGYKGLHVSTNDLQVNPNGLTILSGLQIKI